MTILEQPSAKDANKLIPLQVLGIEFGISSFIRKLLFNISWDPQFRVLHAVAANIDTILRPDRLFEGLPIFSGCWSMHAPCY